MDGRGETFFWLKNDKVNIDVPFFQRPYVWGKNEWSDLINSIEDSRSGTMPFIGSFILQKTNESNRFLIIDGQQRVTTFTILIKALLDAKNDELNDAKGSLLDFIYSSKLNNVTLRNEYFRRLNPSRIDAYDYNFVMDQNVKIDDIKCMKGKICEAYVYFYNKFCVMDQREIYLWCSKLITNDRFFISIVLEQDDDEQKIFDSVNSLGKDLSTSDIIKNYIFQKMKDKAMNQLQHDKVAIVHDTSWMDVFYSNDRRDFWEREKNLGRIRTHNLEVFLKDFGTIKKIYIASENGGIYGLAKAYKNFINEHLNTFEDVIHFIEEMSKYANCYYSYNVEYNNLDQFKISDIVNTTLLILDKTETSTFNPFVLKVMYDNININEILFTLQKFIIKRVIYKAKTKNYNKFCESLISTNDPINSLILYEDNEPIDYSQYPSGLLKIKNSLGTLILFLIEIIRRNGDEDKYTDIVRYDNSLEHILPQKWQTKWFDVKCYVFNSELNIFDEVNEITEISSVRKNAISSIGNMTLLKASLNSSISNENFKVKILGNGKNGGVKKFGSSLLVTKEVIDVFDNDEIWNEKNIHERNNQLFKELNDYYKFK